MTTSTRSAPVARALTGAGTAIALIGMVTGFQMSAAIADQQAQADAQTAATQAATTTTLERGQAVRVLDPTLLPAPEAVQQASTSSNSSASSPAAPAARAAPAAPAPAAPAAPAQPAPPANGSTGGSGG